MKQKRLYTGLGAGLAMLILMFDSKTALEGAREGISLCLKTVIPSLFPFFLLSILITTAWFGQPLTLLRPLGKICDIPPGLESILLVSFLGGYPVGAKTVSDLWRKGALSRSEAERLLGFCSNAGPSFLFGMAASLFPCRWMPWALWGIHIVSALLTAQVFPGRVVSRPEPPGETGISVPQALHSAMDAMANVCGWILLFRVVIGFLTRWILWILPETVQVCIIGLLELSNGCCELSRVPNLAVRFVLCSGMLAAGGICVGMQTASVSGGLSLSCYLTGKWIQTLLSILLSAAVVWNIWLPVAAIVLILGILFRKRQNNSSIQVAAGV